MKEKINKTNQKVVSGGSNVNYDNHFYNDYNPFYNNDIKDEINNEMNITKNPFYNAN